MNVVITGGELFNKGAQSMTFTTVNEIKRRYPEAKIALLSTPDFVRDESEKQQYAFDIVPWDLRLKLRRYFFLRPFIKRKFMTAEQEKHAWQVFKGADLLLDISGFGLASLFSKQRVANYLTDIATAKRYALPMILMPQSFGPFDFKGMGAGLFSLMTKRLLRYPKKIFARESEGKKALLEFAPLQNIERSVDIVLQSEEVLKERVFSSSWHQATLPTIDANGVAIIPNNKVIKHGNKAKVQKLYCDIIEHLLGLEKKVYILRHSHEDKKFVLYLKEQFASDDNVVAIAEDFNAIELEDILKQMQFVVASRFHGVVHAYRNAIPCLVLGWAVKYQELTALLKQERFCLDVTSSQSKEQTLSLLEDLSQHHPRESEVISKSLEMVRAKYNVFERVFTDDE